MGRVLAACLLALGLALPAAPEQPDWDETADRLLVIRRHDLGFLEANLGLWSFDPDTQGWHRLRHFSYSASPELEGSFGRGGSLAGADGLVVFQAWPMNLVFEAGSYRVLRRTSPIADPAALGWSLQGPLVGRQDARRLGIEPGTYGIAMCRILFWQFPYALDGSDECPEYLLPGTGRPVRCTDNAPWPLLHRDDGGVLQLTALMPSLDWTPQWQDYTWVLPTLSLDPERGMLWRGTPRGVQLLPVEGGGVGQPVEEHGFDFPPFDDPETTVEAFFYHPRRHQLFLTTSDWLHLIWLDESLAPVGRWDPPEGNTARDRPVSLGALGEQPDVWQQLLPVVAHRPGHDDAFWTSDLWLYNPSARATTVKLRRVAAPSEVRAVELGPHASVRISDALVFLGGGPSGDGTGLDAVVLTAPYRWGEQVVAASRTFTAAPDGGTFGHAVAAAPGRTGYSNHMVYPGDPEPQWMWQPLINLPYAGASTVYADYREPGRFRHNLGVANDSDQAVTLTLVWGHLEMLTYSNPDFIAQRPETAIQTVEVAPHSVSMVRLDTLFPAEVAGLWPPRIAVWGSRPVALWTSMVDNLTGDATFVPYSAFQWSNDLWGDWLRHVRAAVPVVVHGAGEAGTEWRTDIWGADRQLFGGPGLAWLHPRHPATDCGGAAGSDGVFAPCGLVPEIAQPPEAWEHRWASWGTVYPDVARAFEPCAGDDDLHGALEILSATWQAGWTRTYTTRADGGTYGGMLPFYPVGGWPVQHFAGIETGPRFRVNAGLYNGDHDHAITHRITLYDAQGSQVAERTLTLQPLASFQRRLEHLLGLEVGALPVGTYGMTVLPLDEPEHGVKGRSWAWVSLVDNVTGDPTNWW